MESNRRDNYHMQTSDTFVNANGMHPASFIKATESASSCPRVFRRFQMPDVCNMPTNNSIEDYFRSKDKRIDWSFTFHFNAIFR